MEAFLLRHSPKISGSCMCVIDIDSGPYEIERAPSIFIL